MLGCPHNPTRIRLLNSTKLKDWNSNSKRLLGTHIILREGSELCYELPTWRELHTNVLAFSLFVLVDCLSSEDGLGFFWLSVSW